MVSLWRGGIAINIQVEVYSIILLTGLLSLIFVWFGKHINQLKIEEKPKGITNLVITYVSMLRNVVLQNMGWRGENYAAYISTIFLYILISNMSGLFGLNPPTGNYSVTLSFALVSWFFIQKASIQASGLKSYIKGFFEPIFLFVIPNFFGKIAPLISLSLRMFGNVVAGGVIMTLLYQFTGWLTSFVLPGEFNILGMVVAPIFHVYFDIFSAFLQAFIFISLTTILTSVEFPTEN